MSLKHKVDAELNALEEVRQLCLKLAESRREVAKTDAALARLAAQRSSVEVIASDRRYKVEAARSQHEQRAADLLQHRWSRPNFFAHLFRSERWNAWSKVDAPYAYAEQESGLLLQSAERALSKPMATRRGNANSLLQALS
jgi:hypothetical protein